MRLLQPVQVDELKLLESSFQEPVAEWVQGSTYAVGALAVVAEKRSVFERLVAGASSIRPDADPVGWVRRRPVNRWAPFDDAVGTVAVSASPASMVIRPGEFVAGLALLDVQGATRVTVAMDDGSGAERNLLVDQLDLANLAKWNRSEMAAVQRVEAPDGTMRAHRLIASATTAFHYIEAQLPILNDHEIFSAQVKIRPEGDAWPRLSVVAKNGSGPVLLVDPNSGVIRQASEGTGQSGVSFSAELDADGFWLLKISGISALSGSIAPRFRPHLFFPAIVDQPSGGGSAGMDPLGLQSAGLATDSVQSASGSPGAGVGSITVWQPMVERGLRAGDYSPAVVYRRSVNMVINDGIVDWLSYFFTPPELASSALLLDLPPYAQGIVHITLHGPGDVACGTVLVGPVFDLGVTQRGVELDYFDYSLKETDQFGVRSFREGVYDDRLDLMIEVPKQRTTLVRRMVLSSRARPALFIAAPERSVTYVYGTVEGFKVVLPGTQFDICNLKVQGLT